MHVLLIEDDAPLAQATAGAMQARGWRVDVGHRGEPVLRSLRRDHYDVLILDIGLPGIDGLQTLRELREQGLGLPVLLLTARAGVEDRVGGLEAGADDYLGKPFAVAELLARVQALVRRHELRRGGALQLGRLRLDGVARRAWVDGVEAHLTAREHVLLEYLLQHAGRVVTREQIATLVPQWGAGATPTALEVFVSRLRAKLEPAGVRLRTVRGLGYLLEAAPAE